MHVDGLAASIASLIAMAGDTRRVAENAMFMVHRPWTAVMGDAVEMRRQADTLEKAWDAMLATYARRTGRRARAIEKSVATAGGEWWLSAKDAVTEGFADTVEKPAKEAAVYGLRRFHRVPEPLAARAIDDEMPAALSSPPHVADIAPPRVVAPPLDAPEDESDADPDHGEPEIVAAAARRRRIADVLRLTS